MVPATPLVLLVPQTQAPLEVMGPLPRAAHPIVLILGPGLARGFAHVGVIRALVSAKIPVAAIYGTEMGALIGGIFAASGKVNSLDWALLQLKEEVFLQGKGVFSNEKELRRDSRALSAVLDKILSGKLIEQAAVPMRAGLYFRAQQEVKWVQSGLLSAALTAATVSDEFLGEGESVAKRRPFPISEAKAEAKERGWGPVVVVSLQDERQEKAIASATEFADADFIIRPKVQSVGPLDFGNRTDAIFQGKRATEAVITELRKIATP